MSQETLSPGDNHSFEECPECGGDLEYQTRVDVMCLDCEDLFIHALNSDGRGGRWHSLWSFDHDNGLGVVVKRV